jgi:hypothetical protein
MISPTVLASVKGLCPLCASQLHSLEKGTVIWPEVLRISHVAMQSDSRIIAYSKYVIINLSSQSSGIYKFTIITDITHVAVQRLATSVLQ